MMNQYNYLIMVIAGVISLISMISSKQLFVYWLTPQNRVLIGQEMIQTPVLVMHLGEFIILGNNNPAELKDYVAALDNALGKESKKVVLPLQRGDVEGAYADIQELVEYFDYSPSTTLND